MSTIIQFICLPFDFVGLKLATKMGLSPMKVFKRNSRFTLDRGAVFPAKLSSTRYCQRHLVRGGVEISCAVTIKLTKSKCAKVLHWSYLLLFSNTRYFWTRLSRNYGVSNLKKVRHQRERLLNQRILDLCWELYQFCRNFTSSWIDWNWLNLILQCSI